MKRKYGSDGRTENGTAQQNSPRVHFWIETVLGLVSAILLTLTLVVPDWIEVVFRFDPDQRGGSAEWSIAASFAIATSVFATLARLEWRRFRVGPSDV
jgi:hypothetical protein